MNFSKQHTMTFLTELEKATLEALRIKVEGYEHRFELMQNELDDAHQAIATQYEMIEKLTEQLNKLDNGIVIEFEKLMAQLSKEEQAFGNIVELATKTQASLAQLTKAQEYSQVQIAKQSKYLVELSARQAEITVDVDYLMHAPDYRSQQDD